ncbi:MAG TPA: protease pro-enzyme activation domain-containing protein [Candidatus Sulfotelmatobacter sp.]|nr:protease pro-enzyme activation domain-containing protein [Candidatus Sulfotelmatobacter sp.]
MTCRSSFVAKPCLRLTFFAALLCVLTLHAAQAQQVQSALGVPQPLIAEPVDESRLTPLKGNTHPLARPQFDLGTAPATLPMRRMLLVLKRSAEQEAALRKLLDDQQDKASANYHKWLTPDEYGKQFGPADADIQTITSWLQSHGFEVGSTRGRTVLEFSGSASQVQEAFHTTIHKYLVKGEQHWANANDPQIPAALTPAVAGIATLHNFLKKPQIRLGEQAAAAKIIPGKKPQVTFPAQNGQPITHALAPADYAVIYDMNSTYQSGVNGNGITIGVVGRSNLYNGGEDISDFRNYAFSVCCGSFNIVLNGPDPGDLGGGEEAEATLDSTWSGAIAYGANVELVVSATTNTTDGIDLSEAYIVENNFASIMTESFGSCEFYATDSQLAFSYALAEQAAAQGITYMVSTGDNGSEGCDDPSTAPAQNPISVNLLASTPFSTAVGGTMFNENGQDSKYWGSEPPVAESAISYIPEDTWNESGPSAGLWSSSGGASAGNLQGGGTTGGVAKPSWQSGVVGIPVDNVRDLPDVSLTAAGHDPYLICLDGSCVPNSQGNLYVYFASGTSASAPSFAGIMALVDQQMGARQGQANYVLYRLAAQQSAYPAQCNGSNTSTPPPSTCTFNDVTVGNNVVPGEFGTQYQATAGYDLTTGLGSVNVANLLANWNTVAFNATSTVLTVNNSTAVNITHGQSVPFQASVSPSAGGTGTPTGGLALLSSNIASTTSLGVFTLSAGQVLSSTNDLPGGFNYSVWAHYGGDGTFAPSDSIAIPVTVSSELSTTTLSVLTADANGNPLNFTGGPFGSFVYLRADIAGKSGFGTPAGSVTFSDNGSPIVGASSIPLNSQGNTSTPNGILNFDTGAHSISASYGGDASFSPSSTSQPMPFTITPGFYAAIPANQSSVLISAPGASGATTAIVSSSTGFSGTITLTCSGLPVGAACVFTPSSVKAAGVLAATTVGVSVSTTGTSAALLDRPLHRPFTRGLVLYALTFFSMVMISARERRRFLPILLVLMTLLLLSPACGGGGSSSTPPPPPPKPATQAGTYNIGITASSGATISTTGFTLFVQ